MPNDYHKLKPVPSRRRKKQTFRVVKDWSRASVETFQNLNAGDTPARRAKSTPYRELTAGDTPARRTNK